MLLLAMGKLTGPYARQPDRQLFLFLVSKQLEMQVRRDAPSSPPAPPLPPTSAALPSP